MLEEFGEALPTVGGDVHMMSGFFQQLPDREAVVASSSAKRMLIPSERNAASRFRAKGRGRGGGQGKGQGEVHGRAVPGFAVHAEPALEQLDELGDDGKAEPGPLVAADKGLFNLDERIENRAQLFVGDPDSRVSDNEQDMKPGRENRGQRVDFDGDLSGLRELDGIAHQIEQDLAHPRIVADQHQGHAGGNVKGEFEPFFLGWNQEQLQYGFFQGADFELALLDGHAAEFDARQVQDVREQSGEAFGRFQADLDESPVLFVLQGCLQELQDAVDAIQGGSGSHDSCWPVNCFWRGWPPRRPPWHDATPPRSSCGG